MSDTGREQDQDGLLRFLRSPGALGAAAPQETETSCAHIFLTEDRAFKLKRAVRYDYLDFSTTERRTAACAAEVALNRRSAPDIYLGLAPVLRVGDKFSLGDLVETPSEDANVVDHLVVMRRFDPDATLDRLADAGRLEGHVVDRLAREVARLHRDAKVVKRGTQAQRLARVSGRTMNAILAGRAQIGEDIVPLLQRGMEGILIQSMSEVDARGAEGYVRRLHGDLHLGNVALIDGAPVIFDALEFDDDMATVDVLHDLAFLAMDLWARGDEMLAARLWSGYLAEADDYSGLALAPLFIAMRAAVRSKVALNASELKAASARAASLLEARSYADAARRALERPAPRLVAIGGLSGAGKTFLARELAPKLAVATGAVHLRSDALRKRRAGVAFDDRLPASAYDKAETRAVYKGLLERAAEVLKQGCPVILDAVYASPAERDAVEALARDLNAPFDGVWLDGDLEARKARIAGRAHDASDATAAVAEKQDDYDLGEIRWPRFPASSDVAKKVVRALGL